jgi:hypothetical protein
MKAFAISIAAAMLAACSPAPSAETAAGEEASAETAQAAAPAGAEDAIVAWYRAQHGADLIEPVSIFYGDYSGDGAADALAFAYFAMGGSSAGLSVALFRNQGGQMTFARTVDDVYGMEPRNVQFAPGRITLTTSVSQEGDPRCCPTGSQDWTIATE